MALIVFSMICCGSSLKLSRSGGFREELRQTGLSLLGWSADSHSDYIILHWILHYTVDLA